MHGRGPSLNCSFILAKAHMPPLLLSLVRVSERLSPHTELQAVAIAWSICQVVTFGHAGSVPSPLPCCAIRARVGFVVSMAKDESLEQTAYPSYCSTLG